MDLISNILIQLFYSLLYHITNLFQYVCYGIILFLVVIGILYRYNYIHRLLWYIAENEATKLLNGTPVTFGYIKFDLLRGKVWLSNVVIHSPTRPLKSHVFVMNTNNNDNKQQEQKSSSFQSKTNTTTEWNNFANNKRKKSSSSSSVAPGNKDTNNIMNGFPTTADNPTIPTTPTRSNKNNYNNKTSYETRPIRNDEQQIWEWNSPLLGRIGKVYVETNIVLVLLSMIFLLEEPPLELYTIHLSDIQVFVERQYNIYNFYLCDPHIILPDLHYVVDHRSNTESNKNSDVTNQYNGNNKNDVAVIQKDTKTTITEILNDDDDNNNNNKHINDKQLNREGHTSGILFPSSHSCPTFINVPGTTEGNHTQNPIYVKTSSSLDRLSGMTTTTTNTKSTTTNSINSSISTKDSSAIQDSTDSMIILDGRINEQQEQQEQQHKQQQSVQAQKVVDDMIYAVRRAASKGDWNSILLQQRDMITNQLRTFVNNPNANNNEDNHKETHHNYSNYNNTTNTTTTTTGSILEVIEDNIKMIQQVGMSVIEKTQSASQIAIPKRMKQLSPNDKEKIVYGRIGRVLIENMRVFVHKANHINRNNNENDHDNNHDDHNNSNVKNQQHMDANTHGQSSLDHHYDENNITDLNHQQQNENRKHHHRHRIDSLDSTNYIHNRNSSSVDHNNSQNNSVITTIPPSQKSSVVTTTTKTTKHKNTAMLSKEWNKSIYINRVSIRASEFCPPLSAIDRTYQSNSSCSTNPNNAPFNNNNMNNDTNGMMSSPLRQNNSTATNTTPNNKTNKQQQQRHKHQQQSNKMPCLYQPLDKSIDIIVKRIVAEMAKSNTDLFFQTAMEEMADVFFVTNNNNNTTNNSSSSNKNNKKQQTHPPLSTTTITTASTTTTVGTPKRS